MLLLLLPLREIKESDCILHAHCAVRMLFVGTDPATSVTLNHGKFRLLD
jgi:hypothetical protein